MPVEFAEVVERITDAARKVEADRGASPVLLAVVQEFRSKLAKAEGHTVDGVPTRDAVIELEQAGDSAKAAAEADTRLAPESVSRCSPRISRSASSRPAPDTRDQQRK